MRAGAGLVMPLPQVRTAGADESVCRPGNVQPQPASVVRIREQALTSSNARHCPRGFTPARRLLRTDCGLHALGYELGDHGVRPPEAALPTPDQGPAWAMPAPPVRAVSARLIDKHVDKPGDGEQSASPIGQPGGAGSAPLSPSSCQPTASTVSVLRGPSMPRQPTPQARR
jgi:hypothetical protein